MASEIVRGLFGFDPQEKAMQQEQADMINAYKIAQLDPMQQASFLGMQGINMAKRGLGGAAKQLFGIQDPEMQENALLEQSARELYSSGVDPLSTQGLSTLMQRLNAAGARPQTLERLSGALQQARMNEAKLGTEVARADQLKMEKLPKEVQLLNLYNELPDTDPRKKMVEEMLIKEKAQSDPEFIKLQRARDAAPVGSPQRAELDQLIKAEITGRGTRGKTDVKIQMPGTQDAIDVPKFMNSLGNTVQPYTQSIDSADRGLAAMKEVQRGNAIAYNAAVKSLVATLEKGNLSDKDIQAAGFDPSLVGRVTDWVSILGSGVPTQKTQQDVIRTLKVIKKVAATKQGEVINQQAEQLRAAGFQEPQINTLLGQYKTYKPKGTKPTSEMSIEELRQEALK